MSVDRERRLPDFPADGRKKGGDNMRIYVIPVDDRLLLLKTDAESAKRIDDGSLSLDDALFDGCMHDGALIINVDEDGRILRT